MQWWGGDRGWWGQGRGARGCGGKRWEARRRGMPVVAEGREGGGRSSRKRALGGSGRQAQRQGWVELRAAFRSTTAQDAACHR